MCLMGGSSQATDGGAGELLLPITSKQYINKMAGRPGLEVRSAPGMGSGSHLSLSLCVAF